MVTQDIKENIRFFKPNDPYYYEVDNLPLIDLLNNDKILRDEINLILANTSNYATENYVQTNLQAAIGDAGEVDIDGDGITPAFTDLISWINAQGYLSEVATNIGDLLDVDTASNAPGPGDALVYDSTLTKWVPGELAQAAPIVEHNDLDSTNLTGHILLLKSVSSSTGSQGVWVDVTGTSRILETIGAGHDPIKYATLHFYVRAENNDNPYMHVRKGDGYGAYVKAIQTHGADGGGYDGGGTNTIRIPVHDISDTEGPGKYRFQIYYDVNYSGSLIQVFHLASFTQAG
jgi:hypothetical protein